MRAVLTATGLGGLIAASAAAGPLTLVSFSATLLAATGAACWVVKSRDRTANAVAIIAAVRGWPRRRRYHRRVRRTHHSQRLGT
jgi:hypothetical protein